jgi:hypothetical protein
MESNGMVVRAPLLAIFLLGSTAAATQDKKKDDTLKKAGEIATQPVRDVGITRKSIPPVLIAAAEAPYKPPATHWCAPIITELADLDAALGPDFGASLPANENRAGKLAAAGGETVVNSLIPFRGLVREISGAASTERRREAAIAAGLARRGYLRGLAVSRRCTMPP